MAFSSEVGLPPGTRPGDADYYDVAGQTSFERFSSRQQPFPLWDKPLALGGRSISAEEGMVALTLQNLAKPRMPSQSNDVGYGGGGRCDSGAWPMIGLINTGGEGVPNWHHGGGRREPETSAAAADRKAAQLLLRSTSGGSSGIGGPRAEEQNIREMQELESTMPTTAPFNGFRSSDGSSSGRSNSRKARLAASRNDVSSQGIWRTGDSSSLSRLLDDCSYKSSSGSGSSGGGGPGVAQGTASGGGSSSNGARDGGGGGGGGGRSVSWERPRHRGAGGPATTHDGVIIDRNSTSSSSSSRSRVPPKPLRQPSFDPHCKIRDDSLADVCLMPDTKPQLLPPRSAPGGFVKDREAAAVAATTTGTMERSGPSSGGVPYDAQYNRYPPHAGVSPVPSCNSDQGYAPTDATRQQVAPPPTPRVYHERKSSFNLLASMIPDISKVGGRPSAPMAAAWPGAAAGGGIVGRFDSTGAASSMMTHMEDQSEGGATAVWTRQAALARYHRKRKRRPFVKAMRENDPGRREQNKARERPRFGGKFQKKGKDFISVKELQRAGDNRSVSGELPPPPARESTPPPRKINSLNGKCRPSQEGHTAGVGGVGSGSGSSLYLLTPDQVAKLGLES
ncbi:unnamed protein product [Ectocarpus fasciculatus]